MNNWKRRWQGILLGALLLSSSWAEAAPIEMQVVEGDVRSVLLSLARTAHENIVLDDSVAGTVTLHATEEPAKLLRMIAASKGLVLVKEGSTYLVTTMPRADALRSVHVYPVRHADPADLARAAELSLRSAAGDKTADGQEAGTARRVLVDSATNSVLFYGTAAEAANVAKVVPFEFYYSATIQALVTQGKAKMLARPNITTVQGREALINIGGEVPVPTQSVTNNTTTTTYTYRQAGIILRCTPRIHEDGRITATVHTEVSSPLYVEDIKAYRFQNRSADTTVSLRDGETMVIGGLIGSDESRTLSKIPFLGDLPILGSFFRSVRQSRSESEIMIFLTAHVIPDAGAT